MSVTLQTTPQAPLMAELARGPGGVRSAYRAERRKLSSQLAIRVLAAVCLLGPFAFAIVLKIQSATPSDTLFGAWARSSGFAQSLVVLGFCGSWGFPLIAGVVAGDVFSAEDRYGTWKMVLTRSCSRRALFTGKLLAAGAVSVALVLAMAVASVLAGVVVVGDQSLVDLSGTLLSPGHALALVLASWLVSIPPVLAFASLAVLMSVLSRSGIVGVIGPSVVGLAMQLLALVGTGVVAHTLLVGSAFGAWHGLLVARPYLGPLWAALGVCLVWAAACLLVAWRALRARDFAGTLPAHRPGWKPPARVALALTGVLAFLAFAGNWGPAGVTASRLQASITPVFNNLTVLQQRLLGRHVRPGSKLNIRTRCVRHAAGAAQGPGDWECVLSLFAPGPGALPFQEAGVEYDVSVQSNGCYKADSPPAFIGPQTIRDARGREAVNPLFTFYGCFDTI